MGVTNDRHPHADKTIRIANEVDSMGDVNITSHGQKGGITAQNVGGSAKPPKDSGWVKWGVIAAVTAAVIAAMTFYFQS